MSLSRKAALCVAVVASTLAGNSAGTAAERPPSQRVRDLIAEMTLAEKIGQLNMPSRGPKFTYEGVSRGEIGSVLNFFSPEMIAKVHEANRKSRLDIPVMTALDVIHGYRTIFPVPLAEAASFDPSVAERAAYWAGVEAKASGIDLTFSPVADLARDSRWGRIVEGGGEDPLVNGLFAAARVKGFHRGGIGATLKHFAGYSGVEGGRDYGPVDLSLATFRDRFLPSYRAAVEAGVDLVMTSYIALNGVPTTASRFLMTDVLRGEWGFDGYVVSDMNAIKEITDLGFAEGDREAARMAFEAGVDQDMDADLYLKHLDDLVLSGQIEEAQIDRAVARVLGVKERLGLFDAPPFDPAKAKAVVGSPPIRAAARELAWETFVLLKNEGRTLPFPADPGTIALIGPLANSDDHQLGPDTAAAVHADTVTVLAGLKARMPAGSRLLHARGCDILCTSDAGFDEAVLAAMAADRVVMVVGEPRNFSGEGGSRSSLELPGLQRELIRRVAATGKPVTVVLMAGRPLALGQVVDLAPAFLFAWYPGTEGGNAIADILFGDAEPSGRLPVTFPRATGQMPLTYDSLPTARPGRADDRFTSRYVDTGLGPLYPFGYGLAYTSFAYSAPTVLTPLVGPGGEAAVTVTVTNTGDRKGRETVQLYVRDVVASRARPLRELKAFQKVELQPGESRAVTLTVPVGRLGFYLDDGSYVVEPGEFRAFIGGNAEAPAAGSFVVGSGVRRSASASPSERLETGDLASFTHGAQ